MDISALGCEPVRPDRPAGEDVRYDPLFDQLQAEVDRASMPSMEGAVDWEKVVAVASEILSQKSKDLLVASYLGVGLIYTRGVDGLALGLKVHRDLMEHHGPNLFPQRERGRLRSLEWWLEKSEHALKTLEGSPLSPRQRSTMQEHLSKLGQLHSEMLPEAPSLQALHDFLARAAGSCAPKPPEQQDGAKAPDAAPIPNASTGSVSTGSASTGSASTGSASTGSASTGSASTGSVSTGSPSSGSPSTGSASTGSASTGSTSTGSTSTGRSAPQDDLLEVAFHQLRETAGMLLERDLRNPLPYRLSRQSAWLAVAMPPAHVGRTMVPPPSAALRTRIDNLRHHPDTQVVVRELESQLAQFIFWLDLNRFQTEALANVAASEAAVEAIRQETSFLLQRLPGMENLSFADGTPFADPETLRWLRKEKACHFGSEGQRAVPDPKPAGEPALPVANEAVVPAAASNEGALVEAVDRLQDQLKRSMSGRERLQWRLALCRLLLERDKIKFAIPHLEQVLLDIEVHRLEEYDPAFALEGLELAWHGFTLHEDGGWRKKAQDLLNRIARIDAGEVLRVTNGEDNS